MRRKVLLKVFQGSTGPFTQLLGSLFYKQLLRTHSLWHVACGTDRTSGGTTSPRHYTITWGIYCLQQWALQRSWRPGCPASPPQGDTLTLSLIHHHFYISIYQHVSPTLTFTQLILDNEWTGGSLSSVTGSKFFLPHCGMILVRLSLHKWHIDQCLMTLYLQSEINNVRNYHHLFNHESRLQWKSIFYSSFP